MTGRRFFRSLYWKLSAIFLVLLTFVGAAYIYLTIFSTEMYFAETSQRLNAQLAQHIVEDISPILADGSLNHEALNTLFHSVMVVNPGVEVYLLDSTGTILAFDAPPEKVKLRSVSLAPIQEFIGSGNREVILGDNPRDEHEPKVFSAAPMYRDGVVQGYVYVILRGEEFDSVAERIFSSGILQLGIRGFGLSILAAAVVGLLALALVTGKIRRVTRTALAIKGGDLSQRVRITSNDEMDELGEAVNAMADTLAQHVEELKRTDTLRRELIANVSHDLRTPLASMHGYLETILMKGEDLPVEQHERYLGIIMSNTERLRKLVRELFELSRLEAKEMTPELEPFSLAELVNDLMQKFTPAAREKDVKLVARFSQEIPRVVADIGMIDRVLNNLMDNAIAHTGSGGQVCVSLDQEDGKIVTRFEDTGVGIASDDLPFIFDRFFRARRDEKRGGAGLGLAISKRIIEAHGERISVRSEVHRGTSFAFSLTVAEREKEHPQAVPLGQGHSAFDSSRVR